ncbi:MAG TPA: DUF4149 domain-containing protein [Polyangiaceae bacterium]|nr:DUF4149 domain-containing protein [Polyangiaceae bacterium]
MSPVRLAAVSLAFLATGVWLGGILVLGAIVAPTVFREVPAPTSADAMTIVFTTFDKLAMTCAAIIAVAEVVRFRIDQRAVDKIDVARLAVIALAGALAVVQGTWLSPAIIALHQGGAIRGLGPLGEKLERIHAWSERCGKTECLLLIVLVVLLVRANRPENPARA